METECTKYAVDKAGPSSTA